MSASGWFIKLIGAGATPPTAEGACESVERKGPGRYRLRLPHGPCRTLVALEARGQRMLMVFTEAYFEDGLALELWNADNLRTDLREGEEIRLTYTIHRPYAPGEKMTDRHPDSVIAQVVEETIAKRVEHLARPVREPNLPLTPQPEPAFRLFEQDGALYADTKSGPLQKSAPAQPGKQWVVPLTYDDRPADGYSFAKVAARPDGFDQRQVDAAKAALLVPAPPRYPRPR